MQAENTVLEIDVCIEGLVNEFIGLARSAVENLVRMAQIYCNALANGYGDRLRDAIEGKTHINPSMWADLERIGQGSLRPELIMGRVKYHHRWRDLPPHEQDQVLNQGVELLLPEGEVLMVNANNLTKEQVEQVMGDNALRSVPAQRAWLENRKRETGTAAPKPIHEKFQIKKNEVVINEPCRITKKELIFILSQLN